MCIESEPSPLPGLARASLLDEEAADQVAIGGLGLEEHLHRAGQPPALDALEGHHAIEAAQAVARQVERDRALADVVALFVSQNDANVLRLEVLAAGRGRHQVGHLRIVPDRVAIVVLSTIEALVSGRVTSRGQLRSRTSCVPFVTRLQYRVATRHTGRRSAAHTRTWRPCAVAWT